MAQPPQNYMQLLPLDVRRLVAQDLRPPHANLWHHSEPYPPGTLEGQHPELVRVQKGVPSQHPYRPERTLPDTWAYGDAWRLRHVKVRDYEGMASIADYVDPFGRKWQLVKPWDRVNEVNGAFDTTSGLRHHPLEGSIFWKLMDQKTAADVADVCYTRSCQTPRPRPPGPRPALRSTPLSLRDIDISQLPEDPFA